MSYLTYVLLTLGMPRARAVLTSIIVDADKVSKGGTGPRELYAVDAVDDKEAERAYENALLHAALRRRNKRNGS